MSVVVDANVIVALVLPLSYSATSSELVSAWKQADRSLLAPQLLQYEVASALRRAVAEGWLTTESAIGALGAIENLGIDLRPPTSELQALSLQWADRLSRTSTYDTHYLALANHERLDFFTADKRLHNAARRIGLNWVNLVEETRER